MFTVLRNELPALIGVLFGFILLGGVSGYWLTAAFIAMLAYVLFIFHRLRRLEKWLRRGAKVSEVYDDNGFIGQIIRHIYHQKKVNNERKKRTKDILARLNRTISALPYATILLNHNFEIEWCNEPAAYLFGIDPRNDIGQAIGNLIRVPGFLAYLQAPESQERLEIELHGDDHRVVQLKVVQFGGNQYLLSGRNITDQRKRQMDLENFVANASHELKSPLTVIGGHLEMLDDEADLSEVAKRSVQIARRQALRMEQLIQDLLLLSQLESGQLEPAEGEKLSVDDIMVNVFQGIDAAIGPGRVEYTETAGLMISGIAAEIESIGVNLIENALKYAGKDATVRVSWQQNNLGELEFTVSDNGPGIKEQDLAHVADRYYRGSQDGDEPISGNGLGLAIVQQAATRHGGLLDIQSTPGLGSQVKVIFPSFRNVARQRPIANVINLADY